MKTKNALFNNRAGNTSDLIAGALRNAILQGRYQANEPLRQDQIAEELGVSKVPVREALVQLKAEGLVRFLPNRGAVVSELSPAEADEIFTMRIALETKALERAMPNLRSADLIRARGVLEILDTECDRAQWSHLNWEFHATLYHAARMPWLLTTIEMLHNNVTRYLLIYLGRLEAHGQSQQEHWDILSACEKSDLPAAATVLERHIKRASEQLTTFLTNGFDTRKQP